MATSSGRIVAFGIIVEITSIRPKRRTATVSYDSLLMDFSTFENKKYAPYGRKYRKKARPEPLVNSVQNSESEVLVES
jgi:hypothetical protein